MAENGAAGARWKGGKILAALPAGGECMTVEAVAAATDMTAHQVAHVVTALNRAGYVSMARRGCYRRTAAGDEALKADKGFRSGPRGPKQRPSVIGGLNERIWRALRLKRRATIQELLDLIDHDCSQALASASRYLSRLRTVGVTGSPPRKIPGAAMTSPGYKQHILLRDLGPKAPYWRAKEGRMWDPNAQMWLAVPGADPETRHG